MSGGNNWNNQWNNQNPHDQQQGYRNYPPQYQQDFPPQGMPPQGMPPQGMPRQHRQSGGGQRMQQQDYGQYGARSPQQNYWQAAPPQQMHPQHHHQQQQQWRRNQDNQYRNAQQQHHHHHHHHQHHPQQHHQQQQQQQQQQQPQQQLQQQQQPSPSPQQYNAMMSHPSPNQPFVFNANANVFVPRSAMQTPIMVDYGMQSPQPVFYPMQQGYPQQQGYGPPASSSSSYNMQQYDDPRFNQAVDAFGHFGQQSQQYMPSKELYQLMHEVKCPAFVGEIQVGCEQLVLDDVDSMSWADAICFRFRDPQVDGQTKQVAVKLIVEMAFSMEPNQNLRIDPQNTFSNLLMNLSNQTKDFLRQSIIPVLGEYHNNRTVLENDFRVNLAVFYAECFVKLTLDNGSRFEKIGEALCDQVDEIIKFPLKNDYMMCLVRVFKVAGAEIDVSEELRRRVDQILTTMGAFAKGSPVLGDEVKANIFTLIECRTRGWDRRLGAARSRFHAAPDNCEESLDDSADADLTDEQQEFLEKQMDSLTRKEESTDDIDEEVEKEFGKFVSEEYQAIEDAKTAEMLSGLTVNEPEPTASAEEEQKPSE